MATNLHSLKNFYSERQQSEALFLVRVIATEGTTFQKSGATMMVDVCESSYQGLISGGCFERDVVGHCEKMTSEQTAKIVHYDLGSEEDLYFGTGVGCPGKVSLLIERIQGELRDILNDLFLHGVNPSYWITEVYTADGVTCSQNRIAVDAVADSGADYKLVQQLYSPRKALIFGHGDLVSALSGMFSQMYFEHEIWVEKTVSESLFPGASRVRAISIEGFGWPTDVDFTRTDVLLLSHNFHLDKAVINALIDKPVSYVGLLGSQRRIDLLQSSFNPSDWSKIEDKLHAPVGIRLGGREPQQIALAITCELHLHRTVGYSDRRLSSLSKFFDLGGSL